MIQIAIGLYGLDNWFSGDFAGVVDVVRMADENGIDQVTVTDHVIMGEHLENYPYGRFPMGLEHPWYEPLVVLGAFASATKRIRLSTGVLITPLRPAILLAKQLATLDVISQGRVTVGIGLGWQKEEYDGAGIPWEDRYTRMDEQVKVCKLLWSQAPVTFHGKTVDLDRLHSRPYPVQKGGIPIWYGLKPTDRNIDRIAELGDGWVPMEQRADKLREPIAKLHAAFAKRGRDPKSLAVRVVPEGMFSVDGKSNLDAVLARVPEFERAGVTMLELFPYMFCRGPEDLAAFYSKVAAFRKG